MGRRTSPKPLVPEPGAAASSKKPLAAAAATTAAAPPPPPPAPPAAAAPAAAAVVLKTPKNALVAAANGGKIELPADLQQKYGITHIQFTAQGYPIFPPHLVRVEVKIEYQGSRNRDFTEANRQAREQDADFKQDKKNETWHHHEDMTTMQLVPRDLHDAIDHGGGVSVWMQTHAVDGKYGEEAARDKASALNAPAAGGGAASGAGAGGGSG